MKILVISDTHGSLRNFKEVMKLEQPIDMIMHLGDIERDENEIRMLAGPECCVAMVKGNCDSAFFCSEELTRDFTLCGHRFHMEHGNRLPSGMQSIVYRAQELGADVMLFGHTHVQLYTKVDGITILNPGSLTKPRPMGSSDPGYAIIELSENGTMKVKLKTLK